MPAEIGAPIGIRNREGGPRVVRQHDAKPQNHPEKPDEYSITLHSWHTFPFSPLDK
jgi:hypothetical protein